MFVKCSVYTASERWFRFLLNTEMIVTIELLEEHCKVILHVNAGEFQFPMKDIKDCREVYNSFINILATGETTISDNITLLTI